MSKPLDEQYLTWLYHQVGSVRLKNRVRTYWSLLRQLYTKEFVWIIPNDDNRVEDGRELRYEFLEECDIRDVDQNWLGLGCSVLEMMVALSRRLSFEGEGEPAWWFWLMIDNLDLRHFNDKDYDPEVELPKWQFVEDTLDSLIWRTYSHDGRGGLFPLEYAEEDQTELEIWYQMSAYLSEREERGG